MKKTLTWITWLSLSAVSPIALAVGLGQATVSSYLDTPLEAAIPLLESSDYALRDIRVSVADQSDFAAAGLEWNPLAAGVRAQVVEYQGRRQVRLSSGQAMQDPWLDLLLTLEYPGGQQFSDVTLLFDPQDYADNDTQRQPQSFVPATVNNTRPPSVAEPIAPAAMPPRASESGNANSRGDNTAYVGSGDTLWGVAERVKPAEVSVQQMMVALLEANPSVFPSGNIHGMRAGQTLDVPDTQRVLARSRADAAAAIQAMNEAWRARRNGSPQAVPLPEVARATVSEASLEVAQTLSAGEPSETDDITPQESDEPDALSRAELTEQLRISQVTLQQMIEERELMRAELDALRGEVASLTQALSDALAAQQQAQDQAQTPLAASIGEADNQSLSGLIARYQWPLAAAAIALLIGLLVWLRKRREAIWETGSFAEPVIRTTPSPSVRPMAVSEVAEKPLPEAAEFKATSETAEFQVEMEAEAEDKKVNDIFPQAIEEPQNHQASPSAAEPTIDESSRFEKSQAAGLAEQGRQRRLGLQVMDVDHVDTVSLSPPADSQSMRQLLDTISQSALPPSVSEEPLAPSATLSTTTDSHFIDYHPPSLAGSSRGEETLRAETPMQPTVEFASEKRALAEAPVRKPRRPIEEEWEIEEVAFKPRGRDNSGPPKSSK
ncbi:hypothetical protein LCGC14_0210140 [marine sediment metagenome]|uniref:LysM domain-containing protein n=1 Tax=marine sediment metagenome TaxID=412755 RepID=A0A0F9X073_9ZZZZ|nr:FimV/HubP family polar landmark protein [Halomonas sp.]HDZ48253.1 hypothetical protein [Halomonas sp.]HEB04067.1 hypothetical protein [Halomonas sp.]